MSSSDFILWRNGAREYVKKNIDIESVKEANRNLFLTANNT
jgi:hypothetical protein